MKSPRPGWQQGVLFSPVVDDVIVYRSRAVPYWVSRRSHSRRRLWRAITAQALAHVYQRFRVERFTRGCSPREGAHSRSARPKKAGLTSSFSSLPAWKRLAVHLGAGEGNAASLPSFRSRGLMVTPRDARRTWWSSMACFAAVLGVVRRLSEAWPLRKVSLLRQRRPKDSRVRRAAPWRTLQRCHDALPCRRAYSSHDARATRTARGANERERVYRNDNGNDERSPRPSPPAARAITRLPPERLPLGIGIHEPPAAFWWGSS